jgi:membrane associated rhomboid family serine protease
MNYRTERFPIITLSIIGLNTLVYLISLVCFLNTGGESDSWIMENLWLIPNQSFWWTYLTTMFVHAGLFHLVGNMIYLFLFGSCVEDMLGRARFAAFYLVSGFAATFAYIAFSPEHFASQIPMGGASGAISACMGMYLVLRANAAIEFKYFFWFLVIRAGEFELPAWVAITFWFLSDLFWMVVGMYSNQQGGGVAFGAHVGGLLAGVALVGINKLVARPQRIAEATSKNISVPVRARRRVVVAPKMAASETPTIYLHEADQQSGPFTLAQVQAMLNLGSISQATLYWSEGMTEWQSVTDLADHSTE